MNSNILFTSTINDYLVMDHSGNNLNALADNFNHASYELLQKITRDLENNDHAAWRSHLHTLKGIAGIAGAKDLHELCDRLRARNKNQFIDSPKHITTMLYDAINEYEVAIRQILDPAFKNKANSN